MISIFTFSSLQTFHDLSFWAHLTRHKSHPLRCLLGMRFHSLEVPVPSISGPRSRRKFPFQAPKMVFRFFLEQQFPERGSACSRSLRMQPVVFMRMLVAMLVAMCLIVSSPKSHCQLVSWHENYSVVTFHTFLLIHCLTGTHSAISICLCLYVIKTSSRHQKSWSDGTTESLIMSLWYFLMAAFESYHR